MVSVPESMALRLSIFHSVVCLLKIIKDFLFVLLVRFSLFWILNNQNINESINLSILVLLTSDRATMLQDFCASGGGLATLPIRVQPSLVFMATKPHFGICCSPQKSFPARSAPIKFSIGAWLLSLILMVLEFFHPWIISYTQNISTNH